ncbi:TonB-dependent siderophore receptor [Limnothrix sp. FACHB-708]|uniref:TonB-dependent siderophore receptor n=1 Tax=unclassified Limnothrix TaxID=2632864 RepID=UPI0016874006|nr:MULTISPECIES: TonB-dependent siderophore receptor [unclassified Limnothrix]MBD2555035.1 TonB-dependent siderophore receptor [Limnothrix sp. FACHB-708]MBD2591886.1 TonB-dependent siderophore receptor [Limnothrix sp. FACHB-406]
MNAASPLSLSVLLVAIGALAAPAGAESVPLEPLDRFRSNAPATSVESWLAQADRPATVTRVVVTPLPDELEIALETPAGQSLLIDANQFRAEGNQLIAEISNASLALPEGAEFTRTDPTAEVASVRVWQIAPDRIQVVVTGRNGLPTQDVTLATGDLAYSLNVDANAPEEELVVTGQRSPSYRVPNASSATGTDTPILETPFSVQVIPQAVLRDQQVISIEDALTNVSGVSYAGSNSGREATVSIRGFGNQYPATVSVLRDGYRLYGSFQAIPEVANLEQIEVLKGPASILYGQIEPGGIINLVSKQPLAEPFYEVELQGGSNELVRPRIDFGGPLTADGSLRYRLNSVYQHQAPFRDFETDTNRFSIAPALAWKISDQTDLSLNLEYIHQKGPSDFGLSRFEDGVAPVDRKLIITDPEDSITTDYFSTGYQFEHRFSDNWKIRNGFRYISYDYDYSVVALPLTANGPRVTRFYADQDGEDKSYTLQTSLVGNFKTGSIAHQATIGLDLNRSESRIATVFDRSKPSIINIFDRDYDAVVRPDRSSLPPFNDDLTTANRLGFYLQDQINLTENLIVVAGLRYDTIGIETEDQLGRREGNNTELNSWTPRLGILYRPIPELSLFANYSQSFRPTTSTGADGSILKPEEGEGFEVGVKTELFDRRLLATLTYFDITKQNVPVTDPDNLLFSVSSGEQRNRGLEFDLIGELLPGWKILGSYAYIDSEVTEDTNESLIGNRLYGIPEHKATLWTTYEIQSGSLKGLGFGVGFEYASDRYGNLANDYKIGDYFIGNAAIFYQRDNYRFALNFRNFTDETYIKSTVGSNTGLEVGTPFTVTGSASIRF